MARGSAWPCTLPAHHLPIGKSVFSKLTASVPPRCLKVALQLELERCLKAFCLKGKQSQHLSVSLSSRL